MNIDDSRRLQRIIADYAAATARGESLGRQKLLLAHPDLADELQSFFEGYEASGNGAFEATILQRPRDGDTTPIPPADDPDRNKTRGNNDPTFQLKDGVASNQPANSTGHSADSTGHSADSTRPILRQFGDYELLSEIARGGMGVVYKARQISLNRVVAVKMILVGQLACDDDVQRFRAEAEAAANLDHPGIVSVYEVGCHEDQHYFSMGFVEGQSLAEHITEGPLPADEAVRLVREIADAVQHAHERNVIHRDLKPANVLVDHSGHARVTDFGLAKRMRVESNLTGTGQILGTPSYMPPEQASGAESEVECTADVYSLGAILYTLLTGRPPFQAATPMETLIQVVEREPVPPRQLNGELRRDLEVICLKCLRKEPDKRYASAQALSEDLQRLETGRPILARPASVAERSVKWARRRPLATALMALLALVSTLGFAGVAWQWREAEAARVAELENRKKVERLTAELLELYSRLESSPDTTPSEIEQPAEKKPLTSESDEPVVDDEVADLAAVHSEAAQQSEADKRIDQFAARPPPSAFAENMRRAAVKSAAQYKSAAQDRQPQDRLRERAARRLELKLQLKEKIGELREVAPTLADRYQKLAPP